MIQKSIENIPNQVRLVFFLPGYLFEWMATVYLLQQLQPLAHDRPLAALLRFYLIIDSENPEGRSSTHGGDYLSA